MVIVNNSIIKAKKNFLDYKIIERFIAGIVLEGSEIKSIREKQVSINDAYISIKDSEIFIVDMNISHYKKSSHFSSLKDKKRKRKLLLNRKEITRISNVSKRENLVIIPLEIFINDRGYAKIEIALAQRLKKYQLKEKIKEREVKREIKKGYFW